MFFNMFGKRMGGETCRAETVMFLFYLKGMILLLSSLDWNAICQVVYSKIKINKWLCNAHLSLLHKNKYNFF